MTRACADGWITTYIAFTENQESPMAFHMWTAISSIAAILRRHVWLESSGSLTEPGYFIIYPNLFIVLCSPSGVGMHSTAIQLGMDLIDKSGVSLNVLRGKITPARLTSRLHEIMIADPNSVADLLVFSREFRVFARSAYHDSSLIDDITDLYDGNIFDYETEHAGRHQIKKPCLNIMSASTPEGLALGRRGVDVLSAGIGSRLIPVSIVKNPKRKIAWPTKRSTDVELEQKLLSDLKVISDLSGPFFVTPAGKKYYDEWYQTKDFRKKADFRLGGYYSKKHVLTLKIAMVLAAATSDELVIDKPHIELALKLLTQNEESMEFAYSGVSWGEKARFTDLVINRIREAGEISQTDLMQGFRYCMTVRDMQDTMGTIIASGVMASPEYVTSQTDIVREVRKGKTRSRVVYVWKEVWRRKHLGGGVVEEGGD